MEILDCKMGPICMNFQRNPDSIVIQLRDLKKQGEREMSFFWQSLRAVYKNKATTSLDLNSIAMIFGNFSFNVSEIVLAFQFRVEHHF